jgi:hypothetical protein
LGHPAAFQLINSAIEIPRVRLQDKKAPEIKVVGYFEFL